MFALAVVIAVGLSFEFVQGVWLEVNVNGRHVNFLTLPLYWLLWNVLPLTFLESGNFYRSKADKVELF